MIDQSKRDKLRIWIPAIRAQSGADVFVLRLAEALHSAGHEVIVQWFNKRYELLPELMRLHQRPDDIDIIHANSWNAYVFLGMRIPVVTTVLHLVHDPAYAPYRSLAQAMYHRWHVRWREALAIKKSAAVTAISSYVGGTVIEVFGLTSVRIINNWVDTKSYKPSATYRPPRDRKFRLLMVGNHSRRKGSDLLLAFAEKLGAAFDLRCTGGLRGSDDNSRPANISTLGLVSESTLIEEYGACDAVVSLSRYEGFGYTALEGMACGKPFLGFHTSGLTDVVVDGETGFLVPINDVNALVWRCKELAENMPMLERMGRAGRLRALNVFTEKSAVDDYVAIYRKVIGSQ